MTTISLQILLKSSKRVDLDAASIELTTEDFTFASIDAFVRSRFGIAATEKLIFSREGRGAGDVEFVPSKSWLEKRNPVLIVTRSKEPVKPPTSASSEKQQSVGLFSPVMITFTMIIVLIAINIQTGFVYAVHWKAHCDAFDAILIEHNLITSKNVSLEAIAATIGWGFTYLYIRRFLNPETRKNFIQRFYLDAIFGGLAAGAAVFMKHLIVTNLTRNSH